MNFYAIQKGKLVSEKKWFIYHTVYYEKIMLFQIWIKRNSKLYRPTNELFIQVFFIKINLHLNYRVVPLGYRTFKVNWRTADVSFNSSVKHIICAFISHTAVSDKENECRWALDLRIWSHLLRFFSCDPCLSEISFNSRTTQCQSAIAPAFATDVSSIDTSHVNRKLWQLAVSCCGRYHSATFG